ncbi:16S rRNA (cytidine(1402)-2'-O)-methyltransferase [Leptotrichia sp. OH3620_COT-345]|uniref:16S rRNA (cytidine(1402)-2'-O)-methyltransferase n=1 Tax=Leptotrichia sp. OH3620_COT-345 TaxID=2491048 RepID=UPI000F64BF63|nr:16S rRNA (cytidine(1402)-2'-O)-methyltransferase [Leptotrichia sp. OH3620_COT-345]RRD40656.1 16S rRNA (cytidine(1402)-2'-O)-methyltransferase [Leptotrichia sp. OH3620_COT-345]
MLYVIGTPIGNLEDITFRAVRLLKEVDYIFAEDTRVTKKLLNHYEIEKTVYQYHEHNKIHQIGNILNLLKNNKKIALVTDAGTPCISDPGFEVVNEALKENIKVTAIPGPSSIVTGGSISGLDMRRMAYEGFLPKKKGRQTLFNKLKNEERMIVILESPNRILRTLKDIKEYLGERYVVITRELTKVYEEVIRGEVSEIIKKLEKKPVKGEIVLFIRALNDDGIYLKKEAKGEEE